MTHKTYIKVCQDFAAYVNANVKFTFISPVSEKPLEYNGILKGVSPDSGCFICQIESTNYRAYVPYEDMTAPRKSNNN